MCPQGQRRENSYCDWNFCCKQQPPNLDAWPGETDIETQSGATKWRRGWDSNSRNPALSHVIRCYKITVSKAVTGITQNRQVGCGEKHAQIPPCYAANVA